MQFVAARDILVSRINDAVVWIERLSELIYITVASSSTEHRFNCPCIRKCLCLPSALTLPVPPPQPSVLLFPETNTHSFHHTLSLENSTCCLAQEPSAPHCRANEPQLFTEYHSYPRLEHSAAFVITWRILSLNGTSHRRSTASLAPLELFLGRKRPL